MKSFRLAAILTIVVAGGLAWSVSWAIAQQTGSSVPQTLTYQGFLSDASGNPIKDGKYAVTFSIYSSSTGSTALWSERLAVETQNGIFSTTLGNITPVGNVIDTPPLFLGIQVESDSELRPRQELTSVPFAIQAGNAATLGGLSPDEFARTGDVLQGPPGDQGPPGPAATVEDHTIWVSALDMIASPRGDAPSNLVLARGAAGNTLDVTTTSAGDLQWLAKPLALADNLRIKKVTVCYDLSSADSFISQIRITRENEPPSAFVVNDDGTDHKSTDPVCVDSNVVPNEPVEGAMTMSLRLNFANTTDQIRIGGIGILVGE